MLSFSSEGLQRQGYRDNGVVGMTNGLRSDSSFEADSDSADEVTVWTDCLRLERGFESVCVLTVTD